MVARAGSAARRGGAAAVWAAVAVWAPVAAAAQDHVHEQPSWAVDIGVAGANVAVGGLTAAVTAWIRGQNISDAFMKGAVGGAVVFAGKRIAVERTPGAGFAGREVASVGSSIVANGGGGLGWLEEVWLPLGPAWVQVRGVSGRRVRVNMADVATTMWALQRSELRFDTERSLSAGTMVFVASAHGIRTRSGEAAGVTMGGVVLLGSTNLDLDTIQSHELVHVIQADYLLHSVDRQLEAWGWRLLGAPSIPLDVGLVRWVRLPRPLRDLRESEAESLEFR